MSEQQATVLETERLLFRRLVLDDLDDLFALYRDKETRQYFPDGTDGTLTIAETREEIECPHSASPIADFGFVARARPDSELTNRAGARPHLPARRLEGIA
jgi:RimJ/RimL family protein N-acetyltransferase